MNQNDIEKAIEIYKDNIWHMEQNPDAFESDLPRFKLVLQALEKQLQSQWIPVSEKLPEMCGMSLLLVGVNGYDQQRVFQGFTGYCERGTLVFHSNTRDVDINAWDITHWMPLPKPPKEVN